LFFRFQFDEARSVALVPQIIQPGVAQDYEEPTLQVAVGRELFRGAHCAQICFLHQIFGGRRVASQRQGIPVQRIDLLESRCPKFDLKLSACGMAKK
jgi:hypothetical protein